MNMLNSEMRALCSFSDEEQQEFQKLRGARKLEFLATNGLWESRISDSALAIGGVYRLKPQESFIDVEIDWDCVEGALIDPKKLSNDIKNDKRDLQYWKIGFPRFGWVLSGYVMECGYHTNTPIKFQENGTVINERAVSARFVRLEQ